MVMALALIIAVFRSDMAPPTRSSCDMLIQGDANIVLFNDNLIACDTAMREPYLSSTACCCNLSQATRPPILDTLTTMTLFESPINESISDAARLIRKPKTPHIPTRSPAARVLLPHTTASRATDWSTIVLCASDTKTRLSIMDKSPLESSFDAPSLFHTTRRSIDTSRQQPKQFYSFSFLAAPSPMQSFDLTFHATPAPPLHKLGASVNIGFTCSMVVAPSQATNTCDHSLNRTTLNAYSCDLSHCSYQYARTSIISACDEQNDRHARTLIISAYVRRRY